MTTKKADVLDAKSLNGPIAMTETEVAELLVPVLVHPTLRSETELPTAMEDKIRPDAMGHQGPQEAVQEHLATVSD